MKRFILAAFALLTVASAGAQGWGLGARLGSGFQAVGQRYLYNGNYLEGRLGMDWIYHGGLVADVSALHVWNAANMDWTPEGNWFFDAGAGVNFGFGSGFSYLGVQGMLRLGYEFERAPLRLAFDWSPSFGPNFSSVDFVGGSRIRGTVSEFNANGLANFGISCVYLF